LISLYSWHPFLTAATAALAAASRVSGSIYSSTDGLAVMSFQI